MRADRPSYAAIVICGCLVAVVAIAQSGCSLGDPGYADEERGAQSRFSGKSSPDPQPKSSRGGRQSSREEELKDPLIRAFGNALEEADGLEDSEQRDARRILKEADPILSRVREENRQALERANRPPKILKQRQPAKAEPKPAQTAAQPGDGARGR